MAAPHRARVLSVSYGLAEVQADSVGGAEQVLSMLDAALVVKGQRSLVIAPAGSRVRGQLIPCAPVPATLDDRARTRAAEQQAALIAGVVAERAVDVVHLHSLDFHRLVDACGDCSVLVTLHLPIASYSAGTLAQALARDNLELQFVSAAQRATAPAAFWGRPVIENGVDLDRFAPAPSRRRFALALGRICPEKAYPRALAAAARAGVPLLLAGQVFPYREHVAHFEREIRPWLEREPTTARFLGPVGGARKRRLLAAARCLVVPSAVAETSSLVAMEALASGTPVVAWRSGALPEIVDDGRTGFVVDDEAGLAVALRASASLDGAACRAEAERRFSQRRMAADYLALYEALGRRRGPTAAALAH